MYQIILWDVDGTLLDFHAGERAAIRSLFSDFRLGPCTDEMLARYAEINDSFWKRLERNEITKQRVLMGRFERFFAEYGLDTDLAPAFNEAYQLRLGDTIVFQDDSPNVIKSLQGRVRQYVVTNGTVNAQTKKLQRSGLGALMDGVFLSEEIGAEKPNIEFFREVLRRVGSPDPDQVLIVGDSLTSDIRGGINAGIKTCWYNPEGRETPKGWHIDHIIADLHQIDGIIGSGEKHD